MGLVFYLFTGGTSWTGKILENPEAGMISIKQNYASSFGVDI